MYASIQNTSDENDKNISIVFPDDVQEILLRFNTGLKEQ